MRKLLLLFIAVPFYLSAQNTQLPQSFPQQQINQALQQAWQLSQNSAIIPQPATNYAAPKSNLNKFLEEYRGYHFAAPKVHSSIQSRSNNTDTLYVGASGNDTLTVTGTWQNSGPIYVVNRGVLIFNTAYATILGNVYVLDSGQLIANKSTLYIPQQYFYQRSILTAQGGLVLLKDGTMNFGGLTHNFLLIDSSTITVQNEHFTDWTTTGTVGHPKFLIDTCNTIGEIILSDSSTVSVQNTDTVLLWHHIPKNDGLIWTFPNGVNLTHYSLTPTSYGVTGLKYNVEADNCKLAWWALMPEDGSNVQISNSSLRAIGAWFTGYDSTNVSGLADNSSYKSPGSLLNDRTLILDTTSVTTWSLYPMDKTKITISSCIAGEIGSENTAHTTCNSTFVDGSGGYFWGTDTSLQIAGFGAFTCNVRSEGVGFEIADYCSITNGAATGIDNSILFLIQSSVLQQPIAYDGSDVWVAQISAPSTSYVNDSVPIPGSAYILRGPQSVWMSFDHYKLYYQISGSGVWTSITGNITSPINQGNLTTWNTTGLTAGNYSVILTLYDNYNDSVNAFSTITLLPSSLEGVRQISKNKQVSVFPNPTSNQLTIISNQLSINELRIENILGQTMMSYNLSTDNNESSLGVNIDVSELPAGVYFYQLTTNDSKTITGKFVKE